MRTLRPILASFSALAALAAPARAGDSVVGDDVAPTLAVFAKDGVSLTFGGLLQVHVAPYVGADSLLANDDPASRAGLRMRRARFGADAALPQHVDVLLVLNPLTSDPETGTIDTARIRWSKHPWARFAIGADKVPFTRGELQSSSALLAIERPLAIQTLVPDRRLGATLEGSGAHLGYIAGVMNATEGYELGNQFSGLLYVARVEYAPLGRPAPRDRGRPLRITAGGGGYFEDGPAARVFAASFGLDASAGGGELHVEALCDRSKPIDMPVIAPTLPGTIERCGAYAEAAYTLRVHATDVQPMARVEWVDDNRDVDDAGDALLVAAGGNARLTPNLRLQLDYLGRYERKSAERANDSVILDVQGDF